MNKLTKLLAIPLIICFVCVTSCSSKVYFKDPYKAKSGNLDKCKNIKVTTKDGNQYRFETAYFSEDKLVGVKKSGESQEINIEEILKISAVKKNGRVFISTVAIFAFLIGIPLILIYGGLSGLE